LVHVSRCNKKGDQQAVDPILQSIWPIIRDGVPTTILLTLGLLGLGLLAGFPLAFAQVYGYRPLRWLCKAYEQFFRGIPALVLILIFHSGLARSFNILLPTFTSALIALGLRSSAYQSQIFRGAIQAVSSGQMLAARSIGMSKLQAIRHIILPQAFRLSIPAWTNEYSSVLKDTSLASAIGVVELMKKTTLLMPTIQNTLGARWILVLLVVAALIYLVLTYAGNWGLGFLENRVRIPGFEMKGGVER